VAASLDSIDLGRLGYQSQQAFLWRFDWIFYACTYLRLGFWGGVWITQSLLTTKTDWTCIAMELWLYVETKRIGSIFSDEKHAWAKAQGGNLVTFSFCCNCLFLLFPLLMNSRPDMERLRLLSLA
jgi:hypothetical protein